MFHFKSMISRISLLGTGSLMLLLTTQLQAGWTTPVYVSTTTSDLHDLAVDVSGNATVVWQGYDGTNYAIESASLPYGGSWSSPHTLSQYGINLQSPEVSVDYSGNTVAIWSTYDGSSSIIQGCSLPYGGSWGAPVTISSLGENADSPELSMNRNGIGGHAVAVWHRYNGTNFVVQSSSLCVGGFWTPPLNITPSGEDALVPDVSVDSSGNAVMTCCRYDGNMFTTRAAFLPVGQCWGPNYVISTPLSTASQPCSAVDGSGNTISVWTQFDGSNYTIQASTLPVGGSWSSALSLSSNGQDAYTPTIAMNTAGDAIAAWIRFDGSNYIAQASFKPFDGTWSPPANLSPSGEDAGSISSSVDASGNAMVLWDRTNGMNSVVESASLSKNGNWTSAVTVSNISKDAYAPIVQLDDAGNAVSVWLESDGSTIRVTASTCPIGS